MPATGHPGRSARSAPVVVVTGPPGAGKSTVAGVLVHRFSPSALVAGDEFFGFLREGFVAPWLPASHDQNEAVVEAAALATGRLARGGLTVVYDGVIGPWFVDRFVAAAAVDVVHHVVLVPPVDVCRHRVRTRAGHGFTDLAATDHMYREFATAAVGGRHVLPLTGDESAEQVADAVAERVARRDARHRLTRPPDPLHVATVVARRPTLPPCLQICPHARGQFWSRQGGGAPGLRGPRPGVEVEAEIGDRGRDRGSRQLGAGQEV